MDNMRHTIIRPTFSGPIKTHGQQSCQRAFPVPLLTETIPRHAYQPSRFYPKTNPDTFPLILDLLQPKGVSINSGISNLASWVKYPQLHDASFNQYTGVKNLSSQSVMLKVFFACFHSLPNGYLSMGILLKKINITLTLFAHGPVIKLSNITGIPRCLWT